MPIENSFSDGGMVLAPCQQTRQKNHQQETLDAQPVHEGAGKPACGSLRSLSKDVHWHYSVLDF